MTRPNTPRGGKKKPISIRLHKTLIADLKKVANSRGVRYQTLINSVLEKYVQERGVAP